jgi:hypothetical protein
MRDGCATGFSSTVFLLGFHGLLTHMV